MFSYDENPIRSLRENAVFPDICNNNFHLYFCRFLKEAKDSLESQLSKVRKYAFQNMDLVVRFQLQMHADIIERTTHEV